MTPASDTTHMPDRLSHIKAALERAGVAFVQGLSKRELNAAEQRFEFQFPPDLAAFLSFALPVGDRFPNWRDLEGSALAESFAWPLEGLWFDVEHNHLWLSDWGPKPLDDLAAHEHLRALVAAAPRLIPILGHRYMPARPSTSGNPVLSVYQSDIIYYGADLEEFFRNEFAYYFGTSGHRVGDTKAIEFWSTLVD